MDDDTCTPDKFGARRSVKKLVIRSSPAPGSSCRMTTADHHQSAFSSPSLYSAQARADPVQSQLSEETFNLSAAKVER